MSSGSLPLATYHRAAQVGAGTYGSVLTVYNDEGDECALKVFEKDEELMDVGALREISCLRLIRDSNRHVNIISMVDVQSEWTDDEEGGAGTAGCLGLALPLYKNGSLQNAIEKSLLQSRQQKVEIAHGILSAVAFLHDNGILHRDVKSDNILLDETYQPILIDFSLAKLMDTTILKNDEGISSSSSNDVVITEVTQHTGEVGTVTYTAPEVVARQPYGKPMDVWSIGVVLLEVLQNKLLTATKNSQAMTEIDQALQEMPDQQPFPNLLRGLLQKDPSQRLTCRQALEHPLFCKFGLEMPPVRHLSMVTALPFEPEEENLSANGNNKVSKKQTAVLERRRKTIQRLCNELEYENPMTPAAAWDYSQQLYQLDDTLDNLSESQGLLDCVVLAFRFFETKALDLEELMNENKSFANWDLDEYVDNEATLFMLMDYCLYPRSFQ